MKRDVILFTMIFIFITLGCAKTTGNSSIEIEIKEVFAKLIVSDIGNSLYSGQIKSQVGLEEFARQYSLDLGIKNVDFKQKMLVFGITGNISARVSRFIKYKNSNSFYLDYYDTGIRYKLMIPKKGKRYYYLQIFIIDRIDGIPHIRVKNLEQGLSKIYE
ncbi:MAG: hypothetical protein ABID32_02480 [Candidatus Omnitrophota bacterium]